MKPKPQPIALSDSLPGHDFAAEAAAIERRMARAEVERELARRAAVVTAPHDGPVELGVPERTSNDLER